MAWDKYGVFGYVEPLEIQHLLDCDIISYCTGCYAI